MYYRNFALILVIYYVVIAAFSQSFVVAQFLGEWKIFFLSKIFENVCIASGLKNFENSKFEK